MSAVLEIVKIKIQYMVVFRSREPGPKKLKTMTLSPGLESIVKLKYYTENCLEIPTDGVIQENG